MKITKIEKNDCMEATIVFFYEDGKRVSVGFESKKDRNKMYDELKKVSSYKPCEINIKNINFVNELHKNRMINILSTTFTNVTNIKK